MNQPLNATQLVADADRIAKWLEHQILDDLREEARAVPPRWWQRVWRALWNQ